MLFAAGLGTRMGALTDQRPKPLIPVAGRPLIDHALDLVTPMNLPHVVANLHYKPQLLEAHLAGKNVALSHEAPDILETGGGLRAALPLLGNGPVFTLNSDAVWVGENPLALLANAWDPDRMDALLVCVPAQRAIGYTGTGDFVVDELGRAKRGPDIVYCGAQIIKTQGLKSIEQPAFSLNLLWDKILATQRLFCLTYPGKWCDVGHPKGIDLAETLLESADV